MIAVAVVASLLGGMIALERHRQREHYGVFLRRASEQEELARELVEALTRRIPEDPEHFKYWSAYYAKEAERHAREKRRIQRRMDHLPWEPIPEYDEDPDGL